MPKWLVEGSIATVLKLDCILESQGELENIKQQQQKTNAWGSPPKMLI